MKSQWDKDKSSSNQHDQASKFEHNIDRNTNQDVEKPESKDDTNKTNKS